MATWKTGDRGRSVKSGGGDRGRRSGGGDRGDRGRDWRRSGRDRADLVRVLGREQVFPPAMLGRLVRDEVHRRGEARDARAAVRRLVVEELGVDWRDELRNRRAHAALRAQPHVRHLVVEEALEERDCAAGVAARGSGEGRQGKGGRARRWEERGGRKLVAVGRGGRGPSVGWGKNGAADAARTGDAVAQGELVAGRRGTELLVVADEEELLRRGVDRREHVRLEHLGEIGVDRGRSEENGRDGGEIDASTCSLSTSAASSMTREIGGNQGRTGEVWYLGGLLHDEGD